MTNYRVRHVLYLAFAPFFLYSFSANAQDMAGLEQGIKPYGVYHGGDIDSISMVNGSLTLHIPLISYPQRGGKLHLGLSLVYTTPSLSSEAGQTTCPSSNVCYPTDIHYIPNSPYGGDLKVVPDFYPSGASPNYLNSNIPICYGNGEPYDGGCGYPDPIFEDYSIGDYTGAIHHLGQTGSNSWISRDATGYSINTTVTPANTLVLTDRDGIRYSYMAYPPSVEVLNSGATQVGPPIWGPIAKIEDPNGNFMTANYTATSSASGTTYTPTGWTDTLGRTIPWGVTATSMPGLLGPSGGQSPITISSTRLSFSFPKAVGPTCSTPFGPLCVVQGYSNKEIQSVGLPNGTAYTFAYDPVTGALSQITLPTGGTISYTWGTSSACSGPAGIAENPTYSLLVLSRTVDAHDGAPPQTWNYTYGGSKTIVTDPLGNDTVHVMTALGPQVCANIYETEKDIYAGSSTSGALLEKTVTTYHSDPDPYILANSQEYNSLGGISGLAMNVVPQSVTATDVPSGKTTEVIKSYDVGIALSTNPVVNAIFGDVTQQNEYDFGSGSPGSLIRQTNTTYMALSGPNASSYLANNLLELPYTVQVCSGGGARASYTQYNYDQVSPVSSGLTASASLDTSPATGSYRGNNTSIVRWPNTGGTGCPSESSPSSASVTIQQSYFNTGTVDVATDPDGHPTTYAYSMTYQGAFPTTVTNALGQSDNYGYDFNTGLKTSAEDANSKTTSYGYDSSWRLTSVGYPDGGAMTYCYSDLSATQCPGAASFPSAVFTHIQAPDPSLQIEVDVDGLGRKIKQRTLSDAPVDYVDTAYDPLGRVASVSNPYRSVSDPTYGITSYLYDALGRRTAQCQPGNSAAPSTACVPGNSYQLWTYNGNLVTFRDEDGNQWQRTFDGLGRLGQVVEPTGASTTYSYDSLNNPLTVNQTGVSGDTARNRSFAYDSLSRLIAARNPETSSATTPPSLSCAGATGTTWTACYGYDANGNLTSKTDNRSIVTTYSYDPLNRLISKSYSSNANGSPSTCYQYDTAANGIGRLGNEWTLSPSKASCPTTTPFITQRSILAYDAMGRVLNEQQHTPANVATGTVYAPAYTYDLAGNLITSTDGTTPSPTTTPSGAALTFTNSYDGAGHLFSVTSNWADPTHPSPLFSLPTSPSVPCAGSSSSPYTPFGALQNATYGSGLTLNRGYDVRLRMNCENDVGGNTAATSGTATVTITGSEQTQ
jgi:YD repeat-containing protein